MPHMVYLEPRCRKPKESRALAAYIKYLPVPASVRSKMTILSTKLDAAITTPKPCTKNTGEKTTGRGINLAAAGFP